MNHDELTRSLRPPRLPEATAGISPTDIALAVLIGLFAATLVTAFVLWRRRRRRRRAGAPREAAVHALAEVEAFPLEEQALAVAVVLRRYMSAAAGCETARLTGDEWLRALDRHFSTRFFSEEAGRRLGEDLYGPPGPADALLAPEIRRLLVVRKA